MLVLIGSYTRPIAHYRVTKGEGIYVCRLDMRSGRLSLLGVTKAENPSFLTLSADYRYLYCVNEIDDYTESGSGYVSAFAFDPEKAQLQFINSRRSNGGAPCHIALNRANSHVFVANYQKGNVMVYPVETGGALGCASCEVQHDVVVSTNGELKKPHAHYILPGVDDSRIFVSDLGLDRVYSYPFDHSTGRLLVAGARVGKSIEGSGPRHMALAERYLYVINELEPSISVFRSDGTKRDMVEIDRVGTLPSAFSGVNKNSEIQLHPSGRFLYGANRGSDTLVAFRVDMENGLLHYIGHQSTGGAEPRHFGIDPSGKYVLAANQNSDSVVVLEIDQSTGALHPTGESLHIPTPVCVRFVPTSDE